MKYTKEERLYIAKRVYYREMTVEEAAVKYDLNPNTVKGYLRLYRAENNLPPGTRGYSQKRCRLLNRRKTLL